MDKQQKKQCKKLFKVFGGKGTMSYSALLKFQTATEDGVMEKDEFREAFDSQIVPLLDADKKHIKTDDKGRVSLTKKGLRYMYENPDKFGTDLEKDWATYQRMKLARQLFKRYCDGSKITLRGMTKLQNETNTEGVVVTVEEFSEAFDGLLQTIPEKYRKSKKNSVSGVKFLGFWHLYRYPDQYGTNLESDYALVFNEVRLASDALFKLFGGNPKDGTMSYSEMCKFQNATEDSKIWTKSEFKEVFDAAVLPLLPAELQSTNKKGCKGITADGLYYMYSNPETFGVDVYKDFAIAVRLTMCRKIFKKFKDGKRLKVEGMTKLQNKTEGSNLSPAEFSAQFDALLQLVPEAYRKSKKDTVAGLKFEGLWHLYRYPDNFGTNLEGDYNTLFN